MRVRTAQPDDAEAACAVIRRSILELCHQDHNGRAEALEPWLANKRPEMFRSWLAIPDQCFVVAVEGSEIAGVGGASAAGEVVLNYVSPDMRFRGVSNVVMAALEHHIAAQGHGESRLTSTATAHGFYRSIGYRDAGEPRPRRGSLTYPMVKRLRDT